MLAIAKKIMENVDWRHLTTGSSGLTGQARSQLNRMLDWRCARGEKTLLEIKKAMGIDYFDNDNFEKEQIAKYAK